MIASVLIVDDSLTVRMDLAQAFGEAGFRSIVCSTAQETRAAIEREPVALMVLDVLLPDENGFDLLNELQARPSTAHIPILMLSTAADVNDRVRALQLGADDFIGKPYEAHYVVARAQELLGLQPNAGSRADSSILLIDDSLTYRSALGQALHDAGYEVLTSVTGEDGLLLASTNRPAAILVDGMLPGMDGASVIRRIRLDPTLRHTPCLLLTASDQATAEVEAFEAGADAFIRKADELDGVLLRLRAALRRSELPPPMESERGSVLAHAHKILAVDQSPSRLEALATGLRGEGYDVVMAHSGEEALQLLSVQPVDCILLDLELPGLSGEHVCERIKASDGTREIPLLMLTSIAEDEALARTLDAGADDYVCKASDFNALRARVRALLRRREIEQERRRGREHQAERILAAAQARAAQELAETRAKLVDQLEFKNRELESFSESVSHDLRAPLRSVEGFSAALLEEHAQSLDDTGLDYLRRVHAAAQRMGGLIDDLLKLSRVASADLSRKPTDLSALARQVLNDLARTAPARRVECVVQDDVWAVADARLMQVVLDNLLGNAWKFTQRSAQPRIEFGAALRQGSLAYYVRDNGAGFDMTYLPKLFRPFRRLHAETDFPGTGVGLSTVQRIVSRHGGQIWAEAQVNRGATFYFTLRTQSDVEPQTWPAVER